ncbi:cancer-related nucleoside-triphosphatase [Takifugu flavidus]|uniref:cancer-related nucleoside-triphosphatase n=1 Tax=Takifugu flavidus TaxID=433684 RepID=UPI002544CECB|nr:cancer-related nucleoside-triphosphatase [Takifugu flavidus]
MFKHVFLTGPPGVGKTTLVHKACEALRSSGMEVEGFYTEEVREGAGRVGFDVVTVRGERRPLARLGEVSSSARGRRGHTVGRYVVDLPSFENLALPLFSSVGSANRGSKKVFVVDEVGKMELFSRSFISCVRRTLDEPSCTILGTVPAPRGKPLALVAEVWNRTDVKVFIVSKENRDALLQDILAALRDCLRGPA